MVKTLEKTFPCFSTYLTISEHKKRELLNCNSLIFRWCHQESNRGHKDFQSFALPTELWHHRICNALFSIASAKVDIFFYPPNYIQKKLKICAQNALFLPKTEGNVMNLRAKPSTFSGYDALFMTLSLRHQNHSSCQSSVSVRHIYRLYY